MFLHTEKGQEVQNFSPSSRRKAPELTFLANAEFFSCFSTTNCYRLTILPSLQQISETLLLQKAVFFCTTMTLLVEQSDSGNKLSVQTHHVAKDTNKFDLPARHSLVEKLAGDVLIGTTVTFSVAPFLTVVDKAIVQSAAGTHSLSRSCFESVQSMFLNPVKYVKSPTFLLMWGVYAATYSSANSLKTLVEHQQYANASKQSSSAKATKRDSADIGKVGIFLGTTIVNSGASLLKDRSYARMFGTSTVQNSIPRLSYGLWIARDLSVVGSSFMLPDLVYPYLVNTYGMETSSAKNFCQLSLPMAAQFVAGPLHFLGLDLYNRNLDAKTFFEAVVDRSKSLYRGVFPVIGARIARIFPGYGFGGCLNTKFRDNWRDYLVEREVKEMMENPMKDASRLVALVHSKTKNRPSAPSDQSVI